MTEPMVICPLDKNHLIRQSRIQFHLVKCKKNHDMSKKEICWANPLHIVDKADIKRHVDECPDIRKAVQSSQVQIKEPPLPGIISVEDAIKAQKAAPNSTENWDADPYHETYDPYQATANREVMRPMMVASKAVKKAWKLQNRQKNAQVDSNSAAVMKQSRELKTKESKIPNRTEHSTPGPSKENETFICSPERKPAKLLLEKNQIMTNLKSMTISSQKPVIDDNDFPALSKPKSYASTVKRNNPPSKQQKSE